MSSYLVYHIKFLPRSSTFCSWSCQTDDLKSLVWFNQCNSCLAAVTRCAHMQKLSQSVKCFRTLRTASQKIAWITSMWAIWGRIGDLYLYAVKLLDGWVFIFLWCKIMWWGVFISLLCEIIWCGVFISLWCTIMWWGYPYHYGVKLCEGGYSYHYSLSLFIAWRASIHVTHETVQLLLYVKLFKYTQKLTRKQ